MSSKAERIAQCNVNVAFLCFVKSEINLGVNLRVGR